MDEITLDRLRADAAEDGAPFYVLRVEGANGGISSMIGDRRFAKQSPDDAWAGPLADDMLRAGVANGWWALVDENQVGFWSTTLLALLPCGKPAGRLVRVDRDDLVGHIVLSEGGEPIGIDEFERWCAEASAP